MKHFIQRVSMVATLLLVTCLTMSVVACGDDDDNNQGGGSSEVFDVNACIIEEGSHSDISSSGLKGEKGKSFIVYVGNKNTGASYGFSETLWSVADPTVATVSPTKGNKVTLKFLKAGNTVLSVTDEKGNVLKANLQVTEVSPAAEITYVITGTQDNHAAVFMSDGTVKYLPSYAIISSVDNDGKNFFVLARNSKSVYSPHGASESDDYYYFVGNGSVFKVLPSSGFEKVFDVGSTTSPVHTMAMRYQKNLGIVIGGVIYDSNSSNMYKPRVKFFNMINGVQKGIMQNWGGLEKSNFGGYRYYVADVYAQNSSTFYLCGNVDREYANSGSPYDSRPAGRVWKKDASNDYKDFWQLHENTTSCVSSLSPILNGDGVLQGFYLGGCEQGQVKWSDLMFGSSALWKYSTSSKYLVNKLLRWTDKSSVSHSAILCHNTLYVDNFKALFGLELNINYSVVDISLDSSGNLFCLYEAFGMLNLARVTSLPNEAFKSLLIRTTGELAPPYHLSIIK